MSGTTGIFFRLIPFLQEYQVSPFFKTLLTLALTAITTHSSAQITLYEHENFKGKPLVADRAINDLARADYSNRASSAVVVGEPWEVCDQSEYRGRCILLRAGNYPALDVVDMNDRANSLRPLGARGAADGRFVPPAPPVPQSTQITLYEHENFQGRPFAADRSIGDLGRVGFSNRASSAVVSGDSWEICDENEFRGRCVMLRAGNYPALDVMGLNGRISSVRALSHRGRVDDRPQEAMVTSVRAVLGLPQRLCWIELEPMAAGSTPVPPAQQMGARRPLTKDLRRCDILPSQARPEYWEITYVFRGQEYRTQVSSQPGHTVTVDERGTHRSH